MLKRTQLFFAGAIFCAGYFVQTSAAVAGFEWRAPVKKAPVVVEKIEIEDDNWMTPIEWSQGAPKQNMAPVQINAPRVQNKVQAVDVGAKTLTAVPLVDVEKEGTIMSEVPNYAPQVITKMTQDKESLKTRASSETEIMDEALQADKSTQDRGSFYVGNAMKSSPAVDVAEGFGRDVSLVMAIRQITPSRYQFIFDRNIDLGQSVDWQGGSIWTEVLGGVLSPRGLSFSVSGNIVTIGYNMAKPASVDVVASRATEVVVSEVAAVAPVVKVENAWSAQAGDMLHDVLKKWAKMSGTELYWAIDYDYEINKNMALSGGYESAVEQLLGVFSEATPRPYGQLHTSSRGPKVLIIKVYDRVN